MSARISPAPAHQDAACVFCHQPVSVEERTSSVTIRVFNCPHSYHQECIKARVSKGDELCPHCVALSDLDLSQANYPQAQRALETYISRLAEPAVEISEEGKQVTGSTPSANFFDTLLLQLDQLKARAPDKEIVNEGMKRRLQRTSSTSDAESTCYLEMMSELWTLIDRLEALLHAKQEMSSHLDQSALIEFCLAQILK